MQEAFINRRQMRQLKITQAITNRESASLTAYLQEIAQEKLLSPEEEVELAQRIKEGDKKALEKLTKANLRFVVSVAKQYQNQGLGLLDLINEGNIGLIKAAEKFDETKGFKFISYAVWWIRQCIEQAISEQGRIVRIPSNQADFIRKIKKEANNFEQQHERRPSIHEISDSTSFSPEKIEDALLGDTQQVSVDTPITNGESSNSLIDMIFSQQQLPTDNALLMESLQEELKRALDYLDERERTIIEAIFGIGQPEMTMAEIGKKYNLTRERVRQIRDKAIRKLRNNTQSKILRAYLGK